MGCATVRNGTAFFVSLDRHAITTFCLFTVVVEAAECGRLENLGIYGFCSGSSFFAIAVVFVRGIGTDTEGKVVIVAVLWTHLSEYFNANVDVG